MSRILVFEDQPAESEDIRKLVVAELTGTLKQLKVESFESIHDFGKTKSTKSNETVTLIITDVLNSKKAELKKYHKLLADAVAAESPQKGATYRAKADAVLVKTAVGSMQCIANTYVNCRCPIIIITKINRPNLIRIFETLNSDANVQAMVGGDVDGFIKKLKKRVRIMYKSGNMILFLKKEYYGCTDDRGFDYSSSHKDFNRWFATQLKKILAGIDKN